MKEYSVTVLIHGKSGHGSRPDLSCNPILCVASAVNSLSYLLGEGRGRITSALSGNSGNIIPDDAELKLICTMEEAELEAFSAKAKETLSAACKMHHCSFEWQCL